MKLLLPLLFFIFLATNLSGQSMIAMTYNIRYDNPADGIHNWDHRKEEVVQLLNFYEPDVFGIQEGLYHQVTYLDEALSGMTYVGAGRDDGRQKGEFSAIFFNQQRFAAIRNATFWLSPNPEQPSVGWDASMERICTYVLLREIATDRKFWVFNAHLDHMGPESREEALKLIWKTIQQLNGQTPLPVILMGDFNAEPAEPPIAFISQHLNDARTGSTNPSYGPEGTFCGFTSNGPPKRRIDYLFVNNQLAVKKYAVIDDTYDDQFYPSDHLPVLAKLEWR